jgi:hypothetical protein
VNHNFICYSSVEAREFSARLATALAFGSPPITVWLDRWGEMRPGYDWDDQLVEAIRTCASLIFVMTPDSVASTSVCKNEWTRALKYKKPVIPVLLDRQAELPFRLDLREYIDFTSSFDAGLARLRTHLAWLSSPAGKLKELNHRLADAQRDLRRASCVWRRTSPNSAVRLTSCRQLWTMRRARPKLSRNAFPRVSKASGNPPEALREGERASLSILPRPRLRPTSRTATSKSG